MLLLLTTVNSYCLYDLVAPTLVQEPPSIKSIRLLSTTNSIEVECLFDDNVFYASTLSCAAITSGMEISSTGEITSEGSSISFQPFTSLVSLTIAGLTALSDYDVYCYVQTVQGFSSSFEDVLNTKNFTRTSCCHTVKYTNSPADIFADISRYETGDVATTEYVYEFLVSSLPSDLLTVQPVLIDSSGKVVPSSVASFEPPTISFSSEDLPTGQFLVIAANSSVKGSFEIHLQLTGDNGADFVADVVEINIIPSGNVPIPFFKQIQLEDTGTAVLIQFNVPTDQAGMGASIFLCSQLFIFATADSATCAWLNSTIVRGVLGTFDEGLSDILEINGLVTLIGGILRPACDERTADCSNIGFVDTQTTTLLAPSNPVTPQVVISVPAVISSCENLTIDASLSFGSAGRPWTSVDWTVVNDATATIDFTVQSYLRGFGVSIQRPLIVPSSILQTTTYTVSLAVRNFLGQSSVGSASFKIDENPNIPVVTIPGSSLVQIKAKDPLTVLSAARFSACATVTELSYQYSISLDGLVQSQLRSSSLSPKTFTLPAYSLLPRRVYIVNLIGTVPASGSFSAAVGTAAVQIKVVDGAVVAILSGGSNRQVPEDIRFSLDASASFDENVSPSSSEFKLFYSWTCVYSSIVRFGEPCLEIQGLSTSSSVLIIPPFTLSLERKYQFTVRVSSPDGRSATNSVTVKALVKGSPFTLTTTTRSKFNTDSQLLIDGFVQGGSDLTAQWSALLSGNAVLFRSLTSQARNFSSVLVSSLFSFPLVVAPNVFSPGSTVTFRLTATTLGTSGSALSSYSDIIFIANTSPKSGSFVVSPDSGDALSTVFSFLSSGWTDDVEDLPLQYLFSYALATSQPQLVLQARSLLNTAKATLPAGLESNGLRLVTTAKIFDNLLSTATTTFAVLVRINPDVVLTDFLSDSLDLALASSDTNIAFQATNNVGSTILVVNCTLANDTFCSSLNRESCFGQPNTCSECLDGFNGVVGPANTRCFSKFDTVGEVGSACGSNSDCLLGNCSNSVCAAPVLRCPSIVPSAVCSGNGRCEYFDNSGNLFGAVCTVFDVFCTAKCICDPGFSGSDCTVDESERATRELTRANMCDGLLSISEVTDPSSDLLDNLVGSLLVSYDPGDVSSSAVTKACSDVLILISNLVESGFLSEAEERTKQFYTESLSRFVVNSDGSEGPSLSGVVDGAVQSLTKGILLSLVNGQAATIVVTNNIRLTAVKDVRTNLANQTLSPPQTAQEGAYKIAGPSLEFAGNDGAVACDGGDGYVSLSVMQWGANPYPNSSQILSPILRFSVEQVESSRRLSPDRGVVELPFKPVYFVTLQFSKQQDFDFSIDLNNATEVRKNNVTFPDCRLFDGTQYIPCLGCNISSYTNTNVTYGCSDISQLCSGGSGNVARLLQEQLYQHGNRSLNSEKLPDGQAFDIDSLLKPRVLQADDDGGNDLSGDVSQFGAIFEAVAAELASVLSSNPFAVDLSKALPVVVFVSCLSFLLLFGSYYFILWDRFDHDYIMYGKNETVRQKQKRSTKEGKAQDLSYSQLSKHPTYHILTPAFASFEFRTIRRWFGGFPRKKRQFSLTPNDMDVSLNYDMIFDDGDASDIGASVGNPSSKKLPFHRLVGKFEEKKEGKATEEIAQLKKKAEYLGEVKRPVADQQSLYSLIVGFMDETVPSDSLLRGANPVLRFLVTVVHRHDFLSMFVGPSLANTRCMRWLSLCRGVLIVLFIDTLFYGIFFQDTGICEQFENQQDCLETQNGVTNRPTCAWDPSADKCSLRPPPENLTFTMIITLVILIIAVPLDFVLGYIMDEYASLRPDLDSWGISAERWLGRDSRSLNSDNHTGNKYGTDSTLGRALRKSERSMSKDSHEARKLNLLELMKQDSITRKVYDDYVSPMEEMEMLLQQTKEFISNDIKISSVAWDPTSDQQLRKAKLKAILTHLGIGEDGSAQPLSWWDWLRYGNYRGKLQGKLAAVRKAMSSVVDCIESMGDLEYENKDIALIQMFILEQFTPFKKYVLEKQMLAFNSASPGLVDPLSWFLAWTVTIASMAFFVYWIFAWGIQVITQKKDAVCYFLLIYVFNQMNMWSISNS